MKKTLLTLIAFGSCAMGATETFGSATKTATISLTFDVAALEAISDINFMGNGETKPNFFMFNGSWGSGEAGSLGLANNGSSGSDTSGLWSSWVKGDASGQATDTGLGSIFTSSTNWDIIEAITLVYSYRTPTTGATTVNLAVSIGYDDGTLTTYGETKSNIVFSGTSGFSSTGLTTNDTYVTSYEFSSDYTSLEDAKKMSAALAIPEPTTATLSLLALAGLAARRRRK